MWSSPKTDQNAYLGAAAHAMGLFRNLAIGLIRSGRPYTDQTDGNTSWPTERAPQNYSPCPSMSPPFPPFTLGGVGDMERSSTRPPRPITIRSFHALTLYVIRLYVPAMLRTRPQTGQSCGCYVMSRQACRSRALWFAIPSRRWSWRPGVLRRTSTLLPERSRKICRQHPRAVGWLPVLAMACSPKPTPPVDNQRTAACRVRGSSPISPRASIAVNLVGGPPNVHSLIPDEPPQSASGCRLHRCRGGLTRFGAVWATEVGRQGGNFNHLSRPVMKESRP